MKIRQRLAFAYIRAKFGLLSVLSPSLAARNAFKLFCTATDRDVKELPDIFRQAEELNLQFETFRIRGYRWNRGASRKVMILHGFQSSAINFEGYVQPLIDKGFEVLAFDGPAHGRSSGKYVNAFQYRDFIKQIHENLGPMHAFIGHSLGGLSLSLALAELEHDEKLRVAIIAPATETRTAINHFCRQFNLKPDVKKLFEDIIVTKGGRSIEAISVTESMKKIKASVLWIHDEDDRVTPLSDAASIRNAAYPNVRFEVTKGLGHSRIYRDGNVVEKVVRFVDGELF